MKYKINEQMRPRNLTNTNVIIKKSKNFEKFLNEYL